MAEESYDDLMEGLLDEIVALDLSIIPRPSLWQKEMSDLRSLIVQSQATNNVLATILIHNNLITEAELEDAVIEHFRECVDLFRRNVEMRNAIVESQEVNRDELN